MHNDFRIYLKSLLPQNYDFQEITKDYNMKISNVILLYKREIVYYSTDDIHLK